MQSTCVYGVSVVMLVLVLSGLPLALVQLDLHESFRQGFEHFTLLVYRLSEGLNLLKQHILVLSQLGIRQIPSIPGRC